MSAKFQVGDSVTTKIPGQTPKIGKVIRVGAAENQWCTSSGFQSYEVQFGEVTRFWCAEHELVSAC